MSGITTLCANFLISDVKGILICFVYEDHLGKCGNHGLVEGALLRYCCDVAMMDEPLDWEKQAGFPTVVIADEARYFVFVLLLVVV